MTRAPSLSPLLVKEARALLPLWAGTIVALAAAFAWRRSLSDIGVFGYVAGVVALGAHSIGHEYGHRALPMLLAQPLARWRVLAAKFVIMGAMLTSLALTAAIVFRFDGFRGDDASRMVILPVLAAIFIAPLFTMLCRSTLAGAVLGPSVPMTLWVVAAFAAWWGFGIDVNRMAAWFRDQWMMVAGIACPILAVLTWRTFSRLEAVEGMPTTLTLPRWLRSPAGARRPAPWRALVAKEIHLQQMTIAITLLYGVIWAVGMTLRRSTPSVIDLPLEAVLLLYCMGLALVIGALASAEERQQGTLELQLLQPVSALAQWAVKCVVALGLAVLLGVVMPTLLLAAFAVNTGRNPVVGMSLSLVLLVLMLTSSSLYVSSLVSSGVTAMTWSVPAAIGVAIFIPIPADYTEASIVAAQVLSVLIVVVLFWFGYLNPTSAEHPARRTLAQISVVAVLVATGLAAAGALI